jgi:hypothetical protein
MSVALIYSNDRFHSLALWLARHAAVTGVPRVGLSLAFLQDICAIRALRVALRPLLPPKRPRGIPPPPPPRFNLPTIDVRKKALRFFSELPKDVLYGKSF